MRFLFDISHWQGHGPFDFGKAAASGYSGGWVKVSEGSTGWNDAARGQADGMRAAGMAVGYYHYFWNQINPIDQANNAIRRINETGDFSLPFMVDVEEQKDVSNNKANAAILRIFLNTVQDKLHTQPGIYTCRGFWDKYYAPVSWANVYRLWNASYWNSLAYRLVEWLRSVLVDVKPILPKDWSTWFAWQFSSQGIVPGIGSPVDVSVTNDTEPGPVFTSIYRVTAPLGLRVRSGPGTNYPVVTAYPLNTVMTVYGIENNWARTDEGWMSLLWLRQITV